ncbi:hypothetical protein AMS68_005688 [Peltaster fructicola]|uniref:D-serine dehydratase n=1 Tax=Peltaster fructicola TaxID=286661 RepID=A0A6H0XZT0_9PEZI|nr:hypothetical protein AMS68_005688 [Peltaster fructicola]
MLDPTTVYEATAVFPDASEAAAKQYYLGKSLKDVQAPAVVIDAAVARRNCQLMLKTAAELGLDFRAHVKTHKTIQLARLQVGDTPHIKLVVSTVAEAESLLPWLLESKASGKKVDILYGLPVAPSAVPRLARIAKLLGEGSVGLFVDNADHVKVLEASHWPYGKTPVFVKVDLGGHRAGAAAGTSQMKDLALALADAKRVHLRGFYAYWNDSYGVNSPEEVLQFLTKELQGLESTAQSFLSSVDQDQTKDQPLILSLGATPTATAIQNLENGSPVARACKSLIEKIKESYILEIHAGVYTLLDMQQLATRARPTHVANASDTRLSFADLGLKILAEVASVYNEREEPEALIAAGSIVLGREPCKSYPGWGVISNWPTTTSQVYDPEDDRAGWTVDRISQEHGVLRWQGSKENFRPLRLGEKLLIWPNHACMAGPNFAFYLIVDSDLAKPDVIVDVWTRCRGW